MLTDKGKSLAVSAHNPRKPSSTGARPHASAGCEPLIIIGQSYDPPPACPTAQEAQSSSRDPWIAAALDMPSFELLVKEVGATPLPPLSQPRTQHCDLLAPCIWSCQPQCARCCSWQVAAADVCGQQVTQRTEWVPPPEDEVPEDAYDME